MTLFDIYQNAKGKSNDMMYFVFFDESRQKECIRAPISQLVEIANEIQRQGGGP